MNISKAQLSAMVLGSFWMLAAGLPAHADDTELFVATSTGAGIKPNVLFIIDNSGSMATTVHTQQAYDPATTYTGSCGTGRVYWRTGTGDAPSCNSDRWFNLSALKCDAAIQAFTRGGQFIDKMVQYDPDTRTWTPISDVGAPSPRDFAIAVWTGSEMMVWGGRGPGGALGDAKPTDGRPPDIMAPERRAVEPRPNPPAAGEAKPADGAGE